MVLRDAFRAGSSVCRFSAWGWKLTDKAGTHNPQTALLGLGGYKITGDPLLRFPSQRHQVKKIFCYLVIAPR